MYIPSDPDMLYSMLNMKLRDLYDSFDELCDCEDVDPAAIIVKLNAAGYEYNEEVNQFRYKANDNVESLTESENGESNA